MISTLIRFVNSFTLRPTFNQPRPDTSVARKKAFYSRHKRLSFCSVSDPSLPLDS